MIGGAASALLNLADGQTQKHSVSIVGQMFDSKYSRFNDVRLHHLEMRSNPSSLRFGLEYGLRIARTVTRYSDADIHQVHSGFAEYVVATLLVQQRVNTRLLHTLYCPVRQDGTRSSVTNALIRTAVRFGIRFVCISENTANSLIHAGVSRSHIYVIPPAVNVSRFSHIDLQSNDNKIRAELGVSSRDPLLLFVGNKKPAKNLDRVLRALKLLLSEFPNTHLVVTTELKHQGYDRRTAQLSELVEKLGIDSHVRWLGIVENMPKLMAAADIVMTPFLHTFGPSDYFIAALEAMAVGKPVVASAVGGMPEVIDDTRGRLIEPTDVEQIAGTLMELLRDEPLRRELGENAQDYVLRHFSPSRIANEMDVVYGEIASE